MASDCLRTFLILCCVAVTTGILSAKGFYCRDPDTGKLYPVNATWPSSSFCGSYTCRLRRRNVTDDHKPLRQMNVTVLSPSVTPEYKDTESSKGTTKKYNQLEVKGYYVTMANQSSMTVEPLKHKDCCNKTSTIKHNCTKHDNNQSINSIKVIGKDDAVLNLNKYEKKERNQEEKESKTTVSIKSTSPEPRRNYGNVLGLKVEDIHATKEKLNDYDRYLNAEEIEFLTALLHKMKKSDLEAIIEMYNLAQEVYKQIDVPSHKSLFEESLTHLKEEKKNGVKLKIKTNDMSYWYEPLSQPSKVKLHDMPGIVNAVTNTIHVPQFQVPTPLKTPPIDMSYAASTHDLPATLSPTLAYTNLQSSMTYNKNLPVNPYNRGQTSMAYSTPSTPKPIPIFGTFFTSTDFRQLPYYYPMSNFQRYNSYLNNKNHIKSNLVQINSPQPKNPARTQNYVSQQNVYLNYIQDQGAKKGPGPEKLYKYLDPPFMWIKRDDKSPKVAVRGSKAKVAPEVVPPKQYFNASYTLRDNVHGSMHPWTLFNVYNQNTNHPSYLSAAYIAQLPNAILVNGELLEDKQDIEQELVTTQDFNNKNKIIHDMKDNHEQKLPDWQSKPLTKSILDEVKANILGKSKFLPFSLRKKIKLERVGKVKKLDDLTRPKRFVSSLRSKRDVTNDEEINFTTDATDSLTLYEVFIEKSLCNSDTEPGFFRMGNITEPFPACCPQRIGTS